MGSEEKLDIIRRYYPIMAGREIDRKFGFSLGYANKLARKIGVKHTPETIERMKRENRLKCHKIDVKAKVRKWKLKRKLDELRLLEGKPQLTKFRIRTIPKRVTYARQRLIYNYGYYACEGDPYTLFYDKDTKRLKTAGDKKGTEGYFVNKYGFKFEQV